MDYEQNNKTGRISLSPQQSILFYSIITGVLAACLIAFMVVSIESQGRAHINRLSQSTANGIASLLKDDLKNRIITLTEFAKSSRLTSTITDDDWHTISKNLYDTRGGYQVIAWIGNDYHIGRVKSFEGNKTNQNINLALNPKTLSAAFKAQPKGESVITMPLSSIRGGAIGIYTPIFDNKSLNEPLAGFISSLLFFDVYIAAILPSYLLMEHDFSLYIDGQEIYSDQTTPTINTSHWHSQANFKFQQQIWQIDIVPTAEFLSRSHYGMIGTLFLLGVLLSVFVTLAVYTALTARNKTKIIIDERNKVGHLLKNLPGMAYQAYDKPNGPMMLVSEGCEVLTGYAKHDFESHRVLWRRVVHPDDYQRVYEIIRQAVSEKKFYEFEYRIICKNKSVRIVWEKGEAVTSLLNNETILEGYITDITDIKNTDKALIRSHKFSDAIVNSVVEAVITIDHKGDIKSFNNAAQRMFGYTFDEVKNTNVKRLMPSAYANHHDQYLTDYIRTNQSNIIGLGRELDAKRKDGSVFPIHLSINDIQCHEDRMFVGLIRDITQQRVIEDQRRMHIEQMSHADRLNSLGEIAAGIAHEVNQPLTAISLFSQSGKSLCNSGKFEKLPEIFEKLNQHSHRAGAVLERMQIMTKQGARQKELLDCNKLIDEVAKLAEHDARMRDINIKISHSSEKLIVLVDLVQIQQVLLNLLRNGMEAMQSIDFKNGSVIEVRTQLTAIESIKISVVDSGCGLSSSMLDKLFSAFSSTKKNGMGIGLSISKSIIEEHGGTIHYTKNIPVGSVFYFMLPLVENDYLIEDSSLTNASYFQS
ncbi:PAS domain S-box protein [Colwellia sp. MB02u-18]|uniref:PAS domain S-box protein n=1 Tax=unclassified Colwellia TaxID=196834 RepID=UPI0015F42B1B|nr:MULTISPECIES: PAS domain S-box protein [unclassified Colwellia]MBA6224787.1 PAS domain S-box protein [Colwellia sp. MB3u-45]MBA6268925.1 PAS domain S-box protein [Colwellia sp. MB3u-43]MBA6321356.1 PAS domain S-box protein [Colwellia sp. MB02u-19]MBA6325909.1 PAS domain S-box protein [Colwellia sp. MB02u-18]MBA6332384.1 PAS domain S-box protein [Colwellia sp. MB02u-12]